MRDCGDESGGAPRPVLHWSSPFVDRDLVVALVEAPSGLLLVLGLALVLAAIPRRHGA